MLPVIDARTRRSRTGGRGRRRLLWGVAAVVVTHDTRMTHYTDRTVEIVDGRLQA